MARPRKSAERAPESKTAVIYSRVSTKEQEEGFSIDAQLGLLRGYAIAKGFEVVKEFIEAETAKQSGRRAFNEMVGMIRSGQASIIIVEKTDRLYRNLKDRVTIDECGAELHLVKENSILSRDSRSHEKFIHDIKVVVAKNYCDNLSEEARKGMREKASQGYWPSKAPLGYQNVLLNGRRVIAPDPVAGPAVRWLFEMYASGDHTLKQLRDTSFALGLKSPNGGVLTKASIHNLLRNPIYIGKVRWDGSEFDGHHDPLTDVETYAKVQAILSSRGAVQPAIPRPGFIYSNLVRCSVCGCVATAYVARGKYIYYACTGARGCERRGVREEALTKAIEALLQKIVVPTRIVALLRESMAQAIQEQGQETEKRLIALRKSQDATRAKLMALYEDFARGSVPHVIYGDLRAQYEKQLQSTEVQIAATVRASGRTCEDSIEIIEALSNSALRFKNAESAFKREMAKRVLSNCTIDGNDVLLEPRPWFKLVAEASAKSVQTDDPERVRLAWWATLDHLRTIDLVA